MTDLLTVRPWEHSALRSLARLRNRALEKTHLTLITALMAAWALDLGTLAVFLYKYRTAAAYSLVGAILAALGAAALVEFRRRNRVRIAWSSLLPLALVHLAFLFAAAWLAWAPGGGSVIENYALYQVDPFSDGTARFAALSELPDGQTFLSPIDALILLKVRNAASRPKIIRDYKLEAWTESGWQSLCQVPFAPNPPYYLFTPARAREIVLTPLALKGPEGPIAPRQDSLFWSAWSCPQKCDLAAAPLRLKMIDRDAREESILFPSNRKPDGAALPSGLDIGGVLDLDGTKEKLYGRKSCASPAGVRRRAHTLW
jgi:hypothetical protein